MQAGEKVAFIEQFDPFIERKAPDDEEKEKIFNSFIELCSDLLDAHRANIRNLEFYGDGAFRKVFESPLRVQAEDGSYLHVLPFGHALPEGIYNMGLVIVMHDEQGRGKEGYLYDIQEDMVVARTPLLPDEALQDDDDSALRHFSVIAQHQYLQDIDELSVSDDIHDRMLADEHRSRIDERNAFERIEEQFGGSKSPTLSELKGLRDVLLTAVPYQRGEEA